MGKVIIRVAKLKTVGNIAASGHHTFREMTTPNADTERTHLNIAGGAASTAALLDVVRERLPVKRRKDAVLCLEYLISASPEHFGGDWREKKNHGEAYFGDAISWLKDKHGAENVVCSNIQLDELTPHLVVYVVPRLADDRLSAKEFTGGRAKLRKLQTDFAKDVGGRHGLERGIEGSKAKHKTVKQFYAQISKPVDHVRISPEVVTPQIVKKGVLVNTRETSQELAARLSSGVNAFYGPAVEKAKMVELSQARVKEIERTSSALGDIEKRASEATKRASEALLVLQATQQHLDELNRRVDARQAELSRLDRDIDRLRAMRDRESGNEYP